MFSVELLGCLSHSRHGNKPRTVVYAHASSIRLMHGRQFQPVAGPKPWYGKSAEKDKVRRHTLRRGLRRHRHAGQLLECGVRCVKGAAFASREGLLM